MAKILNILIVAKLLKCRTEPAKVFKNFPFWWYTSVLFILLSSNESSMCYKMEIIFKTCWKCKRVICLMTGRVSLYFCDKILPSKSQDCFHNSFESLLLRCVERSQEISSPLNQTLAWRFCCLLSPRTETNPTGFDFGWKCINKHFCLGHSKWKTGRVWCFHNRE